MRIHVQRFGTFLSNMVLPNIGAFIAWGLITALFIETGWVTLIGGWVGYDGGYGIIEHLGAWGKGADGTGIVGPMITYLLPLLIGYTGGRMMYDDNIRGGVVGAIATIGAITGASVPMFLGAMVMGPLGGWSMKKLDALWEGKIRPGFEMLVNNFSAGIWAASSRSSASRSPGRSSTSSASWPRTSWTRSSRTTCCRSRRSSSSRRRSCSSTTRSTTAS